MEELGNLPLVLPPRYEQAQIFDAICAEQEPLNEVITRTEREIALLREYRTRLVADVVTGKLDVREAAAHLPNDEPLRDFASSHDPESDLETRDDEEEDAE